MKAKPTGKYKLYKQKDGISGKYELIEDTLEKVHEYLKTKRTSEEIDGFKIYMQEEVIYERNQEEGEDTHGWRNVPVNQSKP